MNDFTKEELITLMKAIHKCSEMTDWPEEAYAVADKIESLIDSYPEPCGLCNRTDCEECPCR